MLKTGLVFGAILIFLLPLIRVFPAEAVASSCGITITPSAVQPNTSVAFQLTFTNTDSVGLKWFKATKPFGGLTTDATSLAGWRKTYTVSGSDITIDENTLNPGDSVTLNLTIGVGDIGGSSGNWVVQGSDDASGANPVTCTGSVGLSVSSGAPDTTAPVISGLSVSGIAENAATVSWTTDEPSTTLVKYDVSAGFEIYPISHSDSNLVTSHSIVLTNSIGASTTYYYAACSTDASGNEGCTAENSFTTAASGTNPTPTPITLPTPTPATVTVAAPGDSLGPRVVITTDLDEVFESAPEIEGRASDASGVGSVEYSTDGGENWLPADEVDEPGDTTVSFRFVPRIFDDGNYDLVVRARDAAGNYGKSDEYEVVIDRLPPRIGGVMFSLGPMVLLPNKEGEIVTLAGLEQKITLSAVGGPVNLDLYVSGRMYSLPRSKDTGLWSGSVRFGESGVFDVNSLAIDGAGNETERSLGKVEVLPLGRIKDGDTGISGAEIKVFSQDELSGIWALWDGEAFGQVNPQISGDDGEYRLFLPPGRYYVEVSKGGFRKLRSEIFSVEVPVPVNMDWEMEKAMGWRIGPLFIPWFGGLDVVSVDLPEVEFQMGDDLVGEEAEVFSLPGISGEEIFLADLRGRPLLVSFVSLWSPSTVEQMGVLDSFDSGQARKLVVVEQDRVAVARIFFGKGGYDLLVAVDEDGELIDDYRLGVLPKHFLLDRKGEIRAVRVGVLSESELSDFLEKF